MIDILLIILIVVVSFAVAFLAYNIMSVRKNFVARLTNLEQSLTQEGLDLETEGELDLDDGEDDLP